MSLSQYVQLYLCWPLTVVCCFQDVHGVIPVEQESDSEGSSVENLGDVTQLGLTGALAQMANLTFMAGTPGNLFNSSKTQIYLEVVLETHNIQTV